MTAPQRVVELLVDPTAACVTITGEYGSGKTEKAIQAVEYVRQRRHFDAMLWADMKRTVAANSAGIGGVSVYDDYCRLVRAMGGGGFC